MAGIKLTDLIEIHILQQLQDAFSEYTKMSVYTCDTEGNKLTTVSNDSVHCREFFRKSESGNAGCRECKLANFRHTLETGETTKFKCHAGLTEFVAPILVNGEVIGCFVSAQMNDGTVSRDKMHETAEKFGFDEAAYIEAFEQLPVFSEEQIDASAKFLCALADLISEMAYTNYVALRSIERLESNTSSQSAFIMDMHDNIKNQMTQIMLQSGEALKSHNPDRMSDTFQEFMLTFPEWIAGYDEVVEYASMGDGSIELDEDIYDIREVLDRMVVYADSRMGMEHVSAVVSVDDSVGEKYMGDSGRLLQILNKIVVETSKKSADGELHVEVMAQKASYATNICINASMYIDDMSMNNLMEAADQSNGADGTIASVGHLAKQMEGSIQVKREDEHHLVFQLVVPQLAVS